MHVCSWFQRNAEFIVSLVLSMFHKAPTFHQPIILFLPKTLQDIHKLITLVQETRKKKSPPTKTNKKPQITKRQRSRGNPLCWCD